MARRTEDYAIYDDMQMHTRVSGLVHHLHCAPSASEVRVEERGRLDFFLHLDFSLS